MLVIENNVMNTTEQRNKIHEYIDRADEQMLHIIEELFKLQETYGSELLSWQKKLLDERIASYEKNPEKARSWEDVKTELKNQLAG